METPKRPTTPTLTNDTMLVLAWDAGACASMHSVLLSTQVSQALNRLTAASGAAVICLLSICVCSSAFSHTGETGGAFLSSHSIFFCLLGIWFGYGPCDIIHQPLRGTFSVCHLRGALLLSMHAALLSAV